MFKDVQLGIHLANGLNIEIPATTVTAGVLYGAMNQGWADLDFAALYKIYAPHGHSVPLPLREKTASGLAVPEPSTIGGELPTATTPLPDSKLIQPVPSLPTLPAPGKGLPPSPKRSPAPELSAGDEAADILEAVIAEFQDIPREGIERPLASPVKTETSGSPLTVNLPSNGEAAVNSQKPAGRRVNFVRRWFVSRTRGS
jgi:hypothetical protein